MSDPTMTAPVHEQDEPADPILDAFVSLIDRISGFEKDLHPEWVDGFFTALLVGPRVVMPSEWMPIVFEDFGRVFADPEDYEKGMQTLTARWNAIAEALRPERLADDPDTLHLRPLIFEYSDEMRAELATKSDLSADEIADSMLDGQVWASGFLGAVASFADDWAPPRKDREAADYLRLATQAVEVVAGNRKDAARYLAKHYPGESLNRDDLVDEMLFYVQELRLFWIEHGHRSAPIRAEPKPGRNDPCHCGSGRKYKHCHGAPH